MKYKEGETTEFKKSTSSLKSAIVSIAAILNKHQHGDIYFGIKDFITIFQRKVPKQKQEKSITKTTPKTTEKIIALIKHDPSISKEELANELQLTVDGVKYHIRKLNKKGVLVWEGSSKAGRWIVG